MLAGLDIICVQLGRILLALREGESLPADSVASTNERLTTSRLGLHRNVVSLIARTALPVSDLRLVVGLLNVTPCIARMGEQCLILATLATPRVSPPSSHGQVYETIEGMGALTVAQVTRAKRAFASRDVGLTDELIRRDADVKRLGRVVFDSAIGDRRHGRSGAYEALAILAPGCLEHIGDDAVEIGEQAFRLVA